jgi:fibronectin-binding autotransporter adhesin
VAAALATASTARAADNKWNVLGGGSQTWETPANWTPAGFPSSGGVLANFAVPLTSNLNVDLSSTVTLGGLNLGGTGAAVTTNITGTGRIVFSDNNDPDFDDNNQIDGNDFLIWQRGVGATVGVSNGTGDANIDGKVDDTDLRAWTSVAMRTFTPQVPPAVLNYPGNIVINSNGAAGTVNRVSVPIRSGVVVDGAATPPTYRTETVEVRGTQSLDLAGGYRVSGDNNVLNSFLPAGAALSIGSLALVEDDTPAGNRTVLLNNTSSALGRIEIPGTISGGGTLFFGHTSANAPISTLVLSGNNTNTGVTTLNRGTIILGSDTALGVGPNGDLRAGNPSNNLGFNVMSDNDARTIAVEHRLTQFVTFAGNNSLTWTGVTAQTNARGIVNVMAPGKTLTLGNIYAATGTSDTGRILVFDGSGTTIIAGVLSGKRYNLNNSTDANGTPANSEDATSEATINSFYVKDGDGALYINGGSTHTGTMTINGGNVHYKVMDDAVASPIQMFFGALGVDTGESALTGNNTRLYTLLTLSSRGGIMLRASEANANINFNVGPIGDFIAAGGKLTLAAPEGGITFTGSVAPVAAEYRLGGGSGTLTMNGVQLTGANSVLVANGGTVQLNGNNTYSGKTTILGFYSQTRTAGAIANLNPVTGTPSTSTAVRSLHTTVLATNTLTNGGVASPLGNSSSAAANLVIQGGTLRYTGSTPGSTDRLFTVGTGGAIIESSGTGTASFTNAGNLTMDVPASRDGSLAGTTTISGIPTTTDLVIGMGVSGTGIPAGATITNITGENTIVISAAATDFAPTTLTFTTVARTVTFGGTNAGDNSFRPNIVNGPLATNVAKNDAGKWILTGTNPYTGTTTVNGGTLVINGTHAGTGAVTVGAAGTLGGTGSLAGAVTVNGTLAPGDGAGTFTTGAVTFNAGSTARFEIGGAGALSDKLVINGALTAGGTFDIDLINGFVPAIGFSVDLIDFTSATGSFAFSLDSLPAGRVWNTSALLTTGVISVAAGAATVPEPAGALLAACGLVAVVLRRRRTN